MSEAMDFVKNIRVGISIGNTLDSTDASLPRDAAPGAFETAWGNPVITEELIDTILKSGFHLIRFPVSWTNHMGPEPDFLIEESWMARVQEVVDYAYKRGAYVILNVHHEDWNYPYHDNCEAACRRMRAVWGQICRRFADYDEHLIFEGQNEPRKIGTELEWNGGDEEGWKVVNITNRAFLETVRGAGGHNPERYVMLPGYAANCTVGVRHIEVPEDSRVIISVHAYEPYEFALQIPGRKAWNHDTAMIDALMGSLKELFTDKGVPVIIGEFGAMNKDGNEEERAEWVNYYVHAAAEIGVPCVWWDNGLFEGEGELFGLFNRHDCSVAYPKLLAGLMDAEITKLAAEAKEHLLGKVVPFWRSLRDDERGGWYGYVSYDLETDRDAVKGCILNSRITWFFANAYLCCKEGLITREDCGKHGFSPEDLKAEAEHGYAFLKEHCLDRENGGIYWSLHADGTPEDTTKHTYNQAFSIYALSSYYEALGDEEALHTAFELFDLIEGRCMDEVGYLEAFTVDFQPASNEKLSENGVMAAKTMNTLLHVFEAYTQLYRVSAGTSEGGRVKERLQWILDTFADKIYNPKLHRQEVFFDENYNPIIDLHSYGHDIETAWLIDLGVEVLQDPAYEKRLAPITKDLTAQIYRLAFNGHSLANECEGGVVNTHRVWWVQAESVVGFLNGYQKDNSRVEYLDAVLKQWEFISEHVVDRRSGSEWFWEVDEAGKPYPDRPIVEPWKCPYHNGRMCMEILKRAGEMSC